MERGATSHLPAKMKTLVTYAVQVPVTLEKSCITFWAALLRGRCGHLPPHSMSLPASQIPPVPTRRSRSASARPVSPLNSRRPNRCARSSFQMKYMANAPANENRNIKTTPNQNQIGTWLAHSENPGGADGGGAIGGHIMSGGLNDACSAGNGGRCSGGDGGVVGVSIRVMRSYTPQLESLL